MDEIKETTNPEEGVVKKQEEVVVKKQADPPKNDIKKPSVICAGLDVGTMNFLCARSDSSEIKLTRNVFLPVREDEISISDLSDINYVKSEDGDIYIIGEDAFRFANIFSKEVSRPMEKGLISPKEVNSIDVLTIIVKNLLGDIREKEVFCSYSVPAEAIDIGRNVIYHQKVFGKILHTLGANYAAVNEAAAVVYSECAVEKFSGIGISFGAGLANFCLCFKGIEAGQFSTGRSGDYIDGMVAESLNMVKNRVTSMKEKNPNFLIDLSGIDKKNHRVYEALQFYYESMLNYTIKTMISEFKRQIDIEIDDPIPIILSGGTSLPNGFLEMFKNIFSTYSFPIKISEIRRAKNPMTCVAQGLLVKTLSTVNIK